MDATDASILVPRLPVTTGFDFWSTNESMESLSQQFPSSIRYYLYCNRNLKLTYQGLNQYHKAGFGVEHETAVERLKYVTGTK